MRLVLCLVGLSLGAAVHACGLDSLISRVSPRKASMSTVQYVPVSKTSSTVKYAAVLPDTMVVWEPGKPPVIRSRYAPVLVGPDARPQLAPVPKRMPEVVPPIAR
jgi:hypothetical protein